MMLPATVPWVDPRSAGANCVTPPAKNPAKKEQTKTQATTIMTFFNKPPVTTKPPNMSENKELESGTDFTTQVNNVDPTFDKENLSHGPSLVLIFHDDVEVVEIE